MHWQPKNGSHTQLVPSGQQVVKNESQVLQCVPGPQQNAFSQHNSGGQHCANSVLAPHDAVPDGHTQRPLSLTLGG